MEGNAAGMVLRLALKTRFSRRGMEFDSSAFRQAMPRWCNGSHAGLRNQCLVRVGSSPTWGTKSDTI